MNIPKRLRDAVMFANWCKNNECDPLETAELLTLIDRAFHLGEQWCNTTGNREKYEMAMKDVEAKALRMGFNKVEWPGLYPSLQKNGFDVWLPTI